MKKSQGFSPIPVLAIVMALVVLTMIGWATYMQFSKAKPAANQNAVACTLDAKLCPDGSSVGRVAPSCEFAACPESNIINSNISLNDIPSPPSAQYTNDPKYCTTTSDCVTVLANCNSCHKGYYNKYAKDAITAFRSQLVCTQDCPAMGNAICQNNLCVDGGLTSNTNSSSNASVNAVTNTNAAANVNATPEVLPAGVKRYTSDALGVTFTYLETAKDYHATVSEIGDKVYIGVNLRTDESITTGQWVQVMAKDPNDTLQQAIEKKYLQGYDPAKCFVRVFPRDFGSYYTGLPTSVTLGIISYPHNTTNDSEPWWSGNSCPAGYSETNGIRYFWMDSAHPEKLLFFSIGQYAINGLNDTQTTWQETLRISDNTAATADWKTYTNTVWGFSFKYPANWTVVANNLPAAIQATLPKEKLLLGVPTATVSNPDTVQARPSMLAYVDPTGWGTGSVHTTLDIKKSATGFTITNESTTTAKQAGSFTLPDYYTVRAAESDSVKDHRFYIDFTSGTKGTQDAAWDATVRQILASFNLN